MALCERGRRMQSYNGMFIHYDFTVGKKIRVFVLVLAFLLTGHETSRADNWMSRLADNMLLTQLSIPGSHDAATGNGFATEWAEYGRVFGQTQECSIAGQWSAGVRAFDLRPALIDNHLHIFHGRLKTNAGFEETIRQIIDSVRVNPGEFAVVVFRHETDGDAGNTEWEEAMKSFLYQRDICRHIVDYRPDLTVADMRGKILLLARKHYADTPVGGYVEEWSSDEDIHSQVAARIWSAEGQGVLFVQDYYETIGSKMNTKLRCMERMFITPSFGELRINHCSAYTNEAMLEGERFATSDGYRDNATHTNHFALKMMMRGRCPGIVMMDYAGVDVSNGYAVLGSKLVRAVIDNNF